MKYKCYGKYFRYDCYFANHNELLAHIARSKRAYKIKDADKKDAWIQRRITKVVGEEGQVVYC